MPAPMRLLSVQADGASQILGTDSNEVRQRARQRQNISFRMS